jgi:23S rRNA (cytidine2498-2'-O)-methyltransferase
MGDVIAYLAADGFVDQLIEELTRSGAEVVGSHGDLLLTNGPAVRAAWATNVWHDATEIAVGSIGEAARTLRGIQRNWACYAPILGGRCKLIAEKLPHVSARPLTVGESGLRAPLGSWTLLAADRLLVAGRCDSPFPNGRPSLIEDRLGPPSRAYLKLWEAFVRHGRAPQTGELCVDLGASPGGWTWLAASHGAQVIAVDKAPLDEQVDAMPGVEWRSGSAFALDPTSFGTVDWMVCDVIAYPRRTLALVKRWVAAGNTRNIICTIKFQGETDHAIVDEFAAIPGAWVGHLHHNKHELTFALIGPAPPD